MPVRRPAKLTHSRRGESLGPIRKADPTRWENYFCYKSLENLETFTIKFVTNVKISELNFKILESFAINFFTNFKISEILKTFAIKFVWNFNIS